MPKKLTKEQFIEAAKLIHGDNYDYSLVDYMNVDTKVKIKCNECGNIFEQTPYTHKKGSGCPKCSAIKRVNRKTLEELKNTFKNIDFSNVKEYRNNEQLLDLICKECGNEFKRTYKELEKGRECIYCKKTSNRKNNLEVFKYRANIIHNKKYDYSLVSFTKAKDYVNIICHCKENGMEHGIFNQTIQSHLSGSGCPKCAKNYSYTTEEFIEKAKLVHGDKYDYSLVEYINADTKIKIKCKKCEYIFEQVADSHLMGNGCPKCNIIKGEEKIRKELEEKNISFEFHKTFSDLKDKTYLSYDFYIPSKNILIEYNGIQHYKWIKFFQKTWKDFLLQKHHDWLKRKYAKDNNINLLVIPYWDFNNINSIL